LGGSNTSEAVAERLQRIAVESVEEYWQASRVSVRVRKPWGMLRLKGFFA
jgi:hypothetical protein